jgi:hypothetical protein
MTKAATSVAGTPLPRTPLPRFLLLLAATFGATLPTMAAADTALNEVTVFGGYRFGGEFDITDSDESYVADDNSSFGLIWNRRARSNTQYEVYYANQSTRLELDEVTDNDSIIDLDMNTLEMGGTYIWDGDMVRPFLSMTLGATHIGAQSPGSESDVFMSGSLGLGLQILPTSRVGIRLEARGHGIFTQKSTDLFCGSGPNAAGCSIRVDATVFGQFEALAGVVVRF